jgi:O-antigen/teichoic acid export membrane protein
MNARGNGFEAVAIPSRITALRRAGDSALVRSSALVFVGTAIARVLGFAFYIAAARLLAPSDYGVVAYALAVVTVASTVVSTSPNGLARFIARHADDRIRQQTYLVNWTGVIGFALIASIAVLLLCAPLARLDGWLLAAVVLNLANMAIFETYTQLQRGLVRFVSMVSYYVLANLLQLVGILVAAAVGWRDPALFVGIYGASAIVALVLMEIVAPTRLRLIMAPLAWARMRQVSRYLAPYLVMGVFYAAWWSADVIMIEHLLNTTAAGNYAAGKTLGQILMLVPVAIGVAATPRIARLPDTALRRYFPTLIGLTLVVLIPICAFVLLVERPLIYTAYGPKYPAAVDALTPIVIGVSLHGLYLVINSAWGGLGRPNVAAVATGLGLVSTVATGLVVIPAVGLVGGGLAFCAGAATQLVVVVAYTLWGVYSGPAPRRGHLPETAMAAFVDD